MNSTSELQNIPKEQVTSANRLHLREVDTLLVKNSISTDSLDEETGTNLFEISSTVPNIQLFDKEGKPFLVDAVFMGAIGGANETFEQDVVSYANISLIPQGGAHPVAGMDYFFGRKDKETLHAFTSLVVTLEYKRIGLGSSILAMEDKIRLLIGREFKKKVPDIKYIEAESEDRTQGEDLGWSSAKRAEDPGWKKGPEEGTFIKTTDMEGNVIEDISDVQLNK